jgi:hypothetical protein
VFDDKRIFLYTIIPKNGAEIFPKFNREGEIMATYYGNNKNYYKTIDVPIIILNIIMKLIDRVTIDKPIGIVYIIIIIIGCRRCIVTRYDFA